MKQPAALRIGQLIFDPNGEYANENAHDSGRRDVASINRKRVAAYTIGAPFDRRGGPLFQSTRSASAGSIEAARFAGIAPDIVVTTDSNRLAAPSTTGSFRWPIDH